jgi:rod shape-determining protein MreD
VKILQWTGLGLALIVAQTTLVAAWRIGMVSPDLLLGGVILLAVYGEAEELFIFAPVLGGARDLFSAAVPGTSLLVLSLLVWFIRSQKTVLDFDSYLLDLVVAGSVLLDGILAVGLQRLATGREMDWSLALLLMAGRALYTIFLVEAGRFLWRNVIEKRLAAALPHRRRFHELSGRPTA